MQRRPIAWLFLPLAALACRLVLAEDVQMPSTVLQPRRGSVFPNVRWLAEEPPLPPVMEPSVEKPEVAKPGTLSSPHQPGSPAFLTLDDLEQIALESNPTLVQARMAVQAAQGAYLQAGLYPNPTIGYIGDEIGNDGANGLQGAGVGQEIVTAGKLRLGRAVASYEIQQARHALEAQRWRVLNDVRAGYYEVLLAQRMLELKGQLVDIGEEGVRVIKTLIDAGEVSKADLLQARIEAETAKLGLNTARNDHRAAWRRLAAVLGRTEMEPAPLAGDVDKHLPEFNWEDTLTRLLTRSPELAKARAGVQRARYELDRQCAARVPNFEIGGAVKYDDASRFTVADVELVLPLPLFNRNQGNIIKAQADLIRVQREVQRVELSLYERLAAVFGQYASARRQVETYSSTIVPGAEESLKLNRDAYRLGEFDYVTLLTAQRTYFTVNLDYLASLKEFWARSVELEGMLLSGGLEAAQ